MDTPYEDILLKTLQPRGGVFLSIMVMEGPNIVKFIAPQDFIDFYLEKALYNKDPSLIVSPEALGFYKWERFIEGEEITRFIKEKFKAIECESLVICGEERKLILTVGYKGDFSLSVWFFEENPNLDHLLE